MELTKEVDYEAAVAKPLGAAVEEGNVVGETNGESRVPATTQPVSEFELPKLIKSWSCRNAALVDGRSMAREMTLTQKGNVVLDLDFVISSCLPSWFFFFFWLLLKN